LFCKNFLGVTLTGGLVLGYVYKARDKSGLTNQYYCENCNRSYKYYRNLKSHQKLECGKEARFLCSYAGCTYKTKIKRYLHMHILNKHSNIQIHDHL
jgi:hypothetical protein